MEILLLEDVPKVGNEGEIIDVADGFARNYLIPQGFARRATPGIKKQAEQIRKAAERRRKRERSSAEEFAKEIEKVTLTFETKVGETGRLYGSVTSADIAERLAEELGQGIDRRALELPESIRQLGTYEIPIRLLNDLVPTFRVEVVGEGGMTAESIDVEVQKQAALESMMVEAEETGAGAETTGTEESDEEE